MTCLHRTYHIYPRCPLCLLMGRYSWGRQAEVVRRKRNQNRQRVLRALQQSKPLHTGLLWRRCQRSPRYRVRRQSTNWVASATKREREVRYLRRRPAEPVHLIHLSLSGRGHRPSRRGQNNPNLMYSNNSIWAPPATITS